MCSIQSKILANALILTFFSLFILQFPVLGGGDTVAIVNAIILDGIKTQDAEGNVTFTDEGLEKLLTKNFITGVFALSPTYTDNDIIVQTPNGVYEESDESKCFIIGISDIKELDGFIKDLKNYRECFSADPITNIAYPLYAIEPNDARHGEYDWQNPEVNNYEWQHHSSNALGIDTDLAWDITQGGPEVKLGHVDFDWNYRAVGSEYQYYPSRNWRALAGADVNSSWHNEHGFYTASVFFGTGNNWSRVAGVNWKSAFTTKEISYHGIWSVLTPRVIDMWMWDLGKMHNAFENLYDDFAGHASVTSISWGHASDNIMLKNRVLRLYLNNGLVYAARGNNMWQSGSYPAKWGNDGFVETVGGYRNNSGTLKSYGVRDSHNGVVAPATNITVLGSDGELVYDEAGTSYAAPIAAGVASLVRSVNPLLSVDDVKWILRLTTNESMDELPPNFEAGRIVDIFTGQYDPDDLESGRGYGTINADRAVSYANLYNVHHMEVNAVNRELVAEQTVTASKIFGHHSTWYTGSATKWTWRVVVDLPTWISDDYLAWGNPSNSLHPTLPTTHPYTRHSDNYGQPYLEVNPLPNHQVEILFWQWQYGNSDEKFPRDYSCSSLRLCFSVLDKKFHNAYSRELTGVHHLFEDLIVEDNGELRFGEDVTHFYAGEYDGDNTHVIRIYGRTVLKNDVYLGHRVSCVIEPGGEIRSDPPEANYTFVSDEFYQVIPEGDLSRRLVWYPAADPSRPTIVDRLIRVVDGGSLVIMPGTEVYFQGQDAGLLFEEGSRFSLTGQSEADGVALYGSGGQRWAGLSFNNVHGDDININYLHIQSANTAIEVNGNGGDWHDNEFVGLSVSDCDIGLKMSNCVETDIRFFRAHNCGTGVIIDNINSWCTFTSAYIDDCIRGMLLADGNGGNNAYVILNSEIDNIDNIGIEVNGVNIAILNGNNIHNCGITGLKVSIVGSLLLGGYTSPFYGYYNKPNEIYNCGSAGTTYDPAVLFYGDIAVHSLVNTIVRDNELGGVLFNAGVEFTSGRINTGPVSFGNNQQRGGLSSAYEFIVGPLSLVDLSDRQFNIFNIDRSWMATTPKLMQVMSTTDISILDDVWWGLYPHSPQDVLDHFIGSTARAQITDLASTAYIGDGDFYPGEIGDISDVDGYFDLLRIAYEKMGGFDGEIIDFDGAHDIYVSLIESGNASGLKNLAKAYSKVGYSNDAMLQLVSEYVDIDNQHMVDTYDFICGEAMYKEGRFSEAIELYDSMGEESEDETIQALAAINGLEAERLSILITSGDPKNAVPWEDTERQIESIESEISLLNNKLFAMYQTGSEDANMPTKFELGMCYPNPFNPSVTVPFNLPKNTEVKITVYNILGERVRTLVDTRHHAGRYQVVWSGKNDGQISVGSGVYFIQMNTPDFSGVKKVILLK